jgi:hypothetical protein
VLPLSHSRDLRSVWQEVALYHSHRGLLHEKPSISRTHRQTTPPSPPSHARTGRRRPCAHTHIVLAPDNCVSTHCHSRRHRDTYKHLVCDGWCKPNPNTNAPTGQCFLYPCVVYLRLCVTCIGQNMQHVPTGRRGRACTTQAGEGKPIIARVTHAQVDDTMHAHTSD